MRLLCERLQKEGFQVKEGLAGIATAFSASFGEGKPVIGLLGEFDALSGLSQEAGLLEESGRPGTVRYFGCPAEEGGSGKTFMTKAGVLIRLRR